MDLSTIEQGIVDTINNAEHLSKKSNFLSIFASPRFYFAILVLAVTIALWIFIGKLSKKYNDKVSSSNITPKEASQKKTISHITASVLKVILIIAFFITFLQVLGANVNSLVAGVSVLIAIIGFALQDAIKDVICGIYIFVDHYFEVGDVIEYEAEQGEIIRMSIRTTRIKSIMDGSIITISNRNFSEAKTLSDIMDIDINLSYDEDVKHVHSVFTSLAAEIGKIKGMTKCEYKGINEFAESSIVYKLRCYCQPKDRCDLKRAALKIIQERLIEENIKIPYKYLNVVLPEKKQES